ncbi:SusD/RagB family nutrient-binding outer membrane lipoprotein [Tenuifilum thalassicum]|uniref:SusD/RagB family nutrient-binding outer membrane lipoprotein n=1 Tax=Tenuifilum thalassicum TaxID=2590900 RepID=A0A7D4C9S4_9BACT|nr:SusD/RagB family nutrient-binding outer membrane lipoprotein [Tenuifilum thalassicum]QKG80402.1 SusD/RagB family nutrient-binding outer membrane lipoprotein [Tenuifilum thalassicum]
MKRKMLFKNIAVILALILTVSSCEWVDPDINVNPDTPADVPMKLILPAVQANLAYDLGGNDIVRPLNMWMQYFNGFARQSLTQGRYNMTPSDVNNVWSSFYYGTLMDIQKIKEKAEATNSNQFKGVAEILESIALMALTDLFGDIPYSEAFQEGANLNPKLDSQQQIYTTVLGLLDDAITNLSAPKTGEALAGDMIYNNNTQKWINAAYALKARAILVQSKRNSNAYQDVINVLNQGGLTSSADNMVFYFSDPDGAGHPLYQFLKERGDIGMGKTFIDYLNSTVDPRIDFFAKNTPYTGGAIGSEDENISTLGDYLAADDAGVWFITYAEQKFMQAEALLPTDKSAAYQAYLEGIQASLEQVGVANASTWQTAYPFFATNVTLSDPNNLTLEMIINQKWVALCGTMYSYNDYRRTGFPNFLVLPQNAALNAMPRRFPYAQSEIVYNSNVDPVSISERVWWDVE